MNKDISNEFCEFDNSIRDNKIKNYVINIINFFNNLRGYMYYNEIGSLIDTINYDRKMIKGYDLHKVNDFVECDKGEEFYNYIVNECLVKESDK